MFPAAVDFDPPRENYLRSGVKYDQLEQAENNTGIIPAPGDDFSRCVEALRNGEVDAMSTGQMILYGFAQERPEFEVVPGIKRGALGQLRRRHPRRPPGGLRQDP